MSDARDAMLNAAIDMLSAYGATMSASQRLGQLACAYQLRLMPVFILALLKYVSPSSVVLLNDPSPSPLW